MQKVRWNHALADLLLLLPALRAKGGFIALHQSAPGLKEATYAERLWSTVYSMAFGFVLNFMVWRGGSSC